MKIKLFFIFLFSNVLFIQPLFGQTQKSLTGFQGLAWGSSIPNVLGKFPNAKQKDICKDLSHATNSYEAVKKKINEDNLGCISIHLDNYVVDGIKFRANFSFDISNKLKHVNLIYAKEQAEGDGYIVECNSVYDRISNLLEARYGESIGVKNIDEFGKNYSKYSVKAWLPLPTEVWIANLSGDKFLKSLRSTSNKIEPDICQVKINYSRKVSKEAEKL